MFSTTTAGYFVFGLAEGNAWEKGKKVGPQTNPGPNDWSWMEPAVVGEFHSLWSETRLQLRVVLVSGEVDSLRAARGIKLAHDR